MYFFLEDQTFLVRMYPWDASGISNIINSTVMGISMFFFNYSFGSGDSLTTAAQKCDGDGSGYPGSLSLRELIAILPYLLNIQPPGKKYLLDLGLRSIYCVFYMFSF